MTICSDHEHISRVDEARVELEGDRELLITGYTWTYFGEFCYFLCCLISFQWIALYILILVDTYNKCEVGGIDNLCFFGNNVIFGTYEFNGKVRSLFVLPDICLCFSIFEINCVVLLLYHVDY